METNKLLTKLLTVMQVSCVLAGGKHKNLVRKLLLSHEQSRKWLENLHIQPRPLIYQPAELEVFAAALRSEENKACVKMVDIINSETIA